MKKLLDNFYIISKLSFTLLLLACLIIALYVLLINYQKENKLSRNQLKFEQDIQDSITQNSKLINQIRNEIQIKESALIEIKKNIELITQQNNENNMSNINESIELLNKNLNTLSNEIKDIKNNTFDFSKKNNKKENINNKNKNEILDLILLKYENNLNFNKEIEFLKKISSEDKDNNFEKLSLLSIKPYKGHLYLKSIFKKELNTYLKEIINNDPDSLFSKIILPYLEISPSSENKIDDDLILKLKYINMYIENNNIELASKNLETIKDYENIFEKSSNEINKILTFKKELQSIRK